MRNFTVGSRRSQLALTQTRWVLSQLEQLNGKDLDFTLHEIVTKGDQILDVTLSKVGGKGLFVKEIEQALFDGKIDFAVHSMKDMPAELPKGLIIGCIPAREDHRDVLISKGHVPLDELPSGAVVGTSSLRRSAQILAKRPDLTIKWIRGNIDTRLKKLETEDYDAIILAAAGLARMGWSKEVVTQYIDPDICIPAVGQGALAIECREDHEELLNILKPLHSEETARAVIAEREFLQKMEGGCQVPIGGYASIKDNGNISMMALIAAPDGKIIYKEIVEGTDPIQVGKEAAELLSSHGAKELIDQVKQELDQ
ncbi:hydroxymethylbilane synthase [Bacillus oleivorans]|uniref:Porphobilinogen deaminase n=1 Tax=Bacillus oleivorans TaxID=1448271 RepID=A0A285CVB7_9BACI|nr:hydroxymethylbilane synthase [Bacillus oleivorans]SNX71510.1 hydroxymethylbilane synthase [Bacillus oleivorans]